MKAPKVGLAVAPVLPFEAMRAHAVLLTELARKYIWWLKPGEALEYPARVIAQVMDRGEFEDVRLMVEALDEEVLREVVNHAEAGQFTPQSWQYWHFRLGLAEPGGVPPLPVRRIASPMGPSVAVQPRVDSPRLGPRMGL